jgi:hypothetical protein
MTTPEAKSGLKQIPLSLKEHIKVLLQPHFIIEKHI